MKVHLRMLGCRLNQAEIDQMARQLQQQGHEIVSDPAQAERVIVNTCAVTREATKSSRKLVRELNRANDAAGIAVTGCYAQISPDDIAVLPGVDRVYDNSAKDTLVEDLTGEAPAPFDAEPIERAERLPGAAGRTRAFIKVQDGCDNACTFCVTTVARGRGQSRPAADIVAEIRSLEHVGFREFVLTGVHLGSYGHDLGDRFGLQRLVERILTETDAPRLRLSSLEPWDLSPDFFDLWRDQRVCRHLHLPLQSGCDATLRRMRRNTTRAEFRALIDAARARIPDVSITTDVIVGFPGETDAEFDESLSFIRQMQFSGMHVFRYSRREGTPAARMRHQVGSAAKKTRSATLRELADEMALAYARRFVGGRARVLWEQVMGASEDGFTNVGYTDTYLSARAIHPQSLTNSITDARIIDIDADLRHLIVAPISG